VKLNKPVVPDKKDHSEYSPSGGKRWVNCPASIRMVKEAPKKESSSFYANEGTAAHELAALCLEEETVPSMYIGKQFNKIIADTHMARETNKYVDYVLGKVTWDSQLFVETRIPMFNLEEDMFGTSDAIIISKDTFEIIDLKYGKGVLVEAEDNYQLAIYAIGIVEWLKTEGIHYSDETEITLTIVQPRAPHIEGPIRSWMVTIAGLKELSHKIKKAVHNSKSENPSFGPSDENCRWCEASPFCKPFAEYNVKAAQLEFADFAKPKNEFSNSLADRNSLSLDQLAKILKHSKAIEQWLKGVTEFAIEEMRRGKEIPTYKLVYGRSIRAWENQVAAEELILDKGIEIEELYTKKFKSPTQMEKTLEPKIWEEVKELVFKPTGKITLAPETDGRSSVSPDYEAAKEWK
jgi:hypothetical protein